ncbi:MAG: DNA repair protein RadC [Acidobacteria bacterium]|nr:MAG: DNA repair protein RadC [Acidobacteriota bacterium]
MTRRRGSGALNDSSSLLPVPPSRSTRGPRLADLPPASRPREKLVARGVGALSQAELLALLLGGGTHREHVLALATRLIRQHSLDGLCRLDLPGWVAIDGIGTARAGRVLAGLELGRRAVAAAEKDQASISTPAAAWQQVRDLGSERREHLVGLYLDGRNRLLARETLSVGSLNTTRTHPREILEPALRHLALGFILAHNHPGGSCEPSSEDLEFTRGIGRAAMLLDIGFYDHLVVTRRGFTSLRERGLMPAGGTW